MSTLSTMRYSLNRCREWSWLDSPRKIDPPDNGSDQYGLRRFEHHEDLLAERLDGAIVCSENARHRELAELAAQAKCQVLCEKPIETSLKAAESMRADCEKNGVSF